MRDRWGIDMNTGARGLEIGHRLVKKGAVKIAGEYWEAVPSRGSLEAFEGRTIEVGVSDAWSTVYTARDPQSLQAIAVLRRSVGK